MNRSFLYTHFHVQVLINKLTWKLYNFHDSLHVKHWMNIHVFSWNIYLDSLYAVFFQISNTCLYIFIHIAYIKRYRNANYYIFLTDLNTIVIYVYILHSVFTLPCNESDALTEFPKVLCYLKKKNLTCKTKQTMHKMK